MPELRWILLILGLAFVGGLALWEARRQRRLPAQVEEPTQHRFREPTLGLPEIRPREAAPELPILEVDDSMIGLRVDGVRIEEDIQVDEPPALAESLPVVQPPQEPVAGLSGPQPPPPPIVEWPPEDQRKLISVRLVASPGERYAGRALRLALSAEGFVHGKFSIFHKPGADARVLVSAASLTQPGDFDLETMDTQRFGGIGLFSVLPGPAPAARMLDELFAVARNLRERLQGFLQDEAGIALDAERMASMRASLNPGPPP